MLLSVGSLLRNLQASLTEIKILDLILILIIGNLNVVVDVELEVILVDVKIEVETVDVELEVVLVDVEVEVVI